MENENTVVECPHCHKSIIEKNNREKKLFMKSGNVLKSKIIFLNDDGSVNVKCKNCDNIVKVPLKIQFEKNQNE